ncbi:MAG: EMC3/TMCO1 family protein [Candidatus Nanohaloarchaea archaeon]
MALGIEPILSTLFSFYNTVFQPLLAFGPYSALVFFSTALAGVFSIIYWFLLDIEKNQRLKDRINEQQEKMKQARKNDESEKASEHMQETMKLNQKMMMLNFKPMIATMVFVALIFPWMGSTFAPKIELQQTGNNTYSGNFTYAGETSEMVVENGSGTVLRIEGEQVRQGEKLKIHGMDWNFKKFGDNTGGFFSSGGEGKIVKLQAVFVPLPFSIPFAGNALNWLGFYILIAMPLTYVFRKLLGVQ